LQLADPRLNALGLEAVGLAAARVAALEGRSAGSVARLL
jgi:hypothetical protein